MKKVNYRKLVDQMRISVIDFSCHQKLYPKCGHYEIICEFIGQSIHEIYEILKKNKA